ncbi:hypothetical protein CLOM_g9795 [Closterium sp. NIES-68]|nr:hypothetical protein CLOM_g9795 [Closterium sp. NIES-68]
MADEDARCTAVAAMSQAIQQGFAYLPPGVRLSSQGRLAAYEKGVVWRVVDDYGSIHCIAFMHINWCFLR